MHLSITLRPANSQANPTQSWPVILQVFLSPQGPSYFQGPSISNLGLGMWSVPFCTHPVTHSHPSQQPPNNVIYLSSLFPIVSSLSQTVSLPFHTFPLYFIQYIYTIREVLMSRTQIWHWNMITIKFSCAAAQSCYFQKHWDYILKQLYKIITLFG
jgi:hypothetical protein